MNAVEKERRIKEHFLSFSNCNWKRVASVLHYLITMSVLAGNYFVAKPSMFYLMYL